MVLPLTSSSRFRLIGSLFLCALLLVLGISSGETFADEPVPSASSRDERAVSDWVSASICPSSEALCVLSSRASNWPRFTR